MGEWDWCVYTAMHGREITREEPAVCRDLNSVLCGDLDGRDSLHSKGETSKKW